MAVRAKPSRTSGSAKIAGSSRLQSARVTIAGLLCLLVPAGCPGVKQSPPGAQPQNTPPPAAAEAAPPVAPSASSPRPQTPTGAAPSGAAVSAPPRRQTPTVAAPSGAGVSEPASPRVAPPVIVGQNAGKSASPAAKASTTA